MTVVCDASVIAAVLRQDDENHARARRWFVAHQLQSERIAAPWILVAEVAGAIRRVTGDADFASRVVTTIVADELYELVPIGRDLATRACDLSAQLGIRGCDAVYVALAADRDISLVTLDRDQRDRASAVIATVVP